MVKPPSILTMLLSSALFLIAMSPTVAARTWTVERDGSGDYAVIQHAVDVAASGDTIRIGVGRFDEKELYTVPGWSDSCRVVVHQHELTIIGSGPETIVGQVEPWELDQGGHKGIVASTLFGNSVIRVQDMRLENMSPAVYASHTAECVVEVSDCSFYLNNLSLYLNSEGGTARVTGCDFWRMPRDGMHVAAWRQAELVVSDCTSRLWDGDPWAQSHLAFNGVQHALVEKCEFLEGSSGIGVSYGGTTDIRDCQFNGQTVVAISPYIQSSLNIEGSTFANQSRVLQSQTSDNQVFVDSCVIEAATDCSFLISHVGSLSVSNCDIARGSRGAVWVLDRIGTCDPEYLDMTNNFWGTDNPDSIDAWIRDRNDSEVACFYIDYEPFRSESTPVESMSLSDFRALFGGDD